MDTAGVEMKRKVAYALANFKKLSKEEVKKIHNEALIFGNNLPLNERGEFFWVSGMETLGMLVRGFDRNKG